MLCPLLLQGVSGPQMTGPGPQLGMGTMRDQLREHIHDPNCFGLGNQCADNQGLFEFDGVKPHMMRGPDVNNVMRHHANNVSAYEDVWQGQQPMNSAQNNFNELQMGNSGPSSSSMMPYIFFEFQFLHFFCVLAEIAF